MANAIAKLDVLACFAERAIALQLVKPELVKSAMIDIQAGRHPVVESNLDKPFIANDLRLDAERKMLVITGPNMGGKSTYMRQNALIALLAHTGSFVPAERAVLGPLDRIFTRIGAADDLAGGRSTFMVEMTEMAHILRNATPNSLVLGDEIGRGTSTFDGLSLAWACAIDLAKKIEAYSLFATHYFEITHLADEMQNVQNVHLSAVEHQQSIVFMYQIKAGAANQSYGIQVARLAGLPDAVLQAAQARLQQLEKQNMSLHDAVNTLGTADMFQSAQLTTNAVVDTPTATTQTPHAQSILEQLQAIDPDDISARDAHQLLYQLTELAAK